MLRGALDVLEPAGAALIGGHSAEGAELALGFAVTGRAAPPGRLLRKGGLRPGDRLILTKPLGTGVILAADGRGLAPARAVDDAIATMLQSAAAAAALPRRPRRHRLHRRDRVRPPRPSDRNAARLGNGRGSRSGGDPGARRRARPLFARGLASSLHADNMAALAALDSAADAHPIAPLLIDPQTAGGLLAGLPAERAAPCLAELRRPRLSRRADRPCRACGRRASRACVSKPDAAAASAASRPSP